MRIVSPWLAWMLAVCSCSGADFVAYCPDFNGSWPSDASPWSFEAYSRSYEEEPPKLSCSVKGSSGGYELGAFEFLQGPNGCSGVRWKPAEPLVESSYTMLCSNEWYNREFNIADSPYSGTWKLEEVHTEDIHDGRWLKTNMSDEFGESGGLFKVTIAEGEQAGTYFVQYLEFIILSEDRDECESTDIVVEAIDVTGQSAGVASTRFDCPVFCGVSGLLPTSSGLLAAAAALSVCRRRKGRRTDVTM